MAGLYQGDIKLEDEKGGGTERNGIVSPTGSYRWPNAQIPYVISTDYSRQSKHTFYLILK